MTAGKAVDDNGFEWSPYGAHYPDFLRLKDVAVTFFDRGERNGIPQACSIRFDRRTRLPILCSSKTSHRSPVKYGPWNPGQTERTWGGGQGARQELHVLRVGPQVAIRLVKPYEAYEHTLSKVSAPSVSFGLPACAGHLARPFGKRSHKRVEP